MINYILIDTGNNNKRELFNKSFLEKKMYIIMYVRNFMLSMGMFISCMKRYIFSEFFRQYIASMSETGYF